MTAAPGQPTLGPQMGARDVQQTRARQGVGQQSPAFQGPKVTCLGRVYDSKEHFFPL